MKELSNVKNILEALNELMKTKAEPRPKEKLEGGIDDAMILAQGNYGYLAYIPLSDAGNIYFQDAFKQVIEKQESTFEGASELYKADQLARFADELYDKTITTMQAISEAEEQEEARLIELEEAKK